MPPRSTQLSHVDSRRTTRLILALYTLQLKITTVFGAFLDPVADKIM